MFALKWLKASIEVFKIQSPLIATVRHYERKPYVRRWGYRDIILGQSLLPRDKDLKPVRSLPNYRPKNRWSKKRALFGQNDYIDILGAGDIHPVQLHSDVPRWLKGFRGNEYAVLTQRLKYNSDFYKEFKPDKFAKMKKRNSYLYKYLNRKTNSSR